MIDSPRTFDKYLTETDQEVIASALSDNGYTKFEERCRVFIFLDLFSRVAETFFAIEDGSPEKLGYELGLKVLLGEKIYFAPHVAEPFLSYLRTCHQMRFEASLANMARNYALVPYKTTYALIESAKSEGFFNIPGLFHD